VLKVRKGGVLDWIGMAIVSEEKRLLKQGLYKESHSWEEWDDWMERIDGLDGMGIATCTK
jgi:hypothetical protein